MPAVLRGDAVADTLRRQLGAADGAWVDSKGCLRTVRKLDLAGAGLPHVPLGLVPRSVRELMCRYVMGTLKPADRSAVYDARKVLRRYGLLQQTKPRICRLKMSPPERRESHRQYLREWRRARRRAKVAPNSNEDGHTPQSPDGA